MDSEVYEILKNFESELYYVLEEIREKLNNELYSFILCLTKEQYMKFIKVIEYCQVYENELKLSLIEETKHHFLNKNK